MAVGRERVLLAAGPAALLLQLAHPLVAAGVAEHSDIVAERLMAEFEGRVSRLSPVEWCRSFAHRSVLLVIMRS